VSYDAFTTLANVRDFLRARVLDVIPHNLHSEMRAAIKILDEIEKELDALPDQLPHECERLLSLCTAGLAQLQALSESNAESLMFCKEQLVQRLGERLGSNRERLSIYGDVLQLSSTLLVHLQRSQRTLPQGAQRSALTEQVRAFYLELQTQAAARQQWQSVFPATVASAATHDREEQANE
jgi:hypothetical protein